MEPQWRAEAAPRPQNPTPVAYQWPASGALPQAADQPTHPIVGLPVAAPPRWRQGGGRRAPLSKKLILPVIGVLVVAGGWLVLRQPLPPLPHDAQSSRVLPVVVPLVNGEFAFLETHPDGSPVAFDPCRPIHWTMNPEGMPAGGDVLVREAIAEISVATGLAFVEDPATTETASSRRPAVQPDRYGDRWAPVLITWEDESTVDDLGGEVAAVAMPKVVATHGPQTARVVTGQVIIDREFTAAALLMAGEGRARIRMVLMHELGHLVGLAHVSDPNAVMSPVASGFLGFGPGDQQGLAAVGNGRCFTDT